MGCSRLEFTSGADQAPQVFSRALTVLQSLVLDLRVAPLKFNFHSRSTGLNPFQHYLERNLVV